MHLCSFEVQTLLGSHERLGLMIAPGVILDLNLAYALTLVEAHGHPRPYAMADVLVPADMMEYLVNGEFGREAVEETLEYLGGMALEPDLEGPDGEQVVYGIDEISLVAPLSRPNSIRVCDARSRSGDAPVVTFDNADRVRGTRYELNYPSDGRHLTFALGIGAVIGVEGQDIAVADVAEHVAGYTVYNGVTSTLTGTAPGSGELDAIAFGRQTHVSVMGPVMATPDDFDPKEDNTIFAHLGEEEWFRGSTRDLPLDFATIISAVSHETRVHVGDVFVVTFSAHESDTLLGRGPEPEEIVMVDVDGIGRLQNQVVNVEE